MAQTGTPFSFLLEEVDGAPQLVSGAPYLFLSETAEVGGEVAGAPFNFLSGIPAPRRHFSAPSVGHTAAVVPGQTYSGQTGGYSVVVPVRHHGGPTSGRSLIEPVQTFSGSSAGAANFEPPRHHGAMTGGSIYYAFLLPPTNLVATPVAPSKISLSWTDTTPDEDGFRVERSPNGQGLWTSIGTVGPDSFLFVDLNATPLVVYDYRVIAFRDAIGVDPAIESAPSNVVSAYSPAPGQPAPPPSTGPLPKPLLEFLSPGTYGLERDLDGNTGGSKV